MAAPSSQSWTVRARALLLVTFVSIASVAPAVAEEGIDWPVEMDTKKGKVVLYQPQLDTFEGNSFTGRAAVSVTPKTTRFTGTIRLQGTKKATKAAKSKTGKVKLTVRSAKTLKKGQKVVLTIKSGKTKKVLTAKTR